MGWFRLSLSGLALDLRLVDGAKIGEAARDRLPGGAGGAGALVGAFGAAFVDEIPPGVDFGVGAYSSASREPRRVGAGAFELKADVENHDVVVIIGIAAVAESLVEMAPVMAIHSGWELGKLQHMFSIVAL